MTGKGMFATLFILGIVALVLTTSWSSVADDNDGPPFSRTGVWIGGDWRTDILWKETVYRCDAAERVLTSRIQWVNAVPENMGAESLTDFVGQYVRTGKNSYAYFAIGYFTGTVDDHPNQVVAIIVMTGRNGWFVDENTWEYKDGTLAIYLPSQDADGDGLPDAGQEPVMAIPYAGSAKRFPLVDVSSPWPETE
jgi:hypothetical protein